MRQKVCLQNTQGNTKVLVYTQFRECMSSGTWIRQNRYRGPQITSNISKRVCLSPSHRETALLSARDRLMFAVPRNHALPGIVRTLSSGLTIR